METIRASSPPCFDHFLQPPFVLPTDAHVHPPYTVAEYFRSFRDEQKSKYRQHPDVTMNPLDEYKKKRRFGATPEPAPNAKRSASGHLFVVQKHRASHLHYDLRLEDGGVLKSWAVPKGPSLDPATKRLAMAVEDHPVDYAEFEGIIPEGEYGGGTVMVWDRGTYEIEGETDVASALHKGELKFTLHGAKLKGSWVLVRTRNRQWLWIKHRDEYASTDDITVTNPTSASTGRKLSEIAADEGGDVEKAATGDPGSAPSVPTPKVRRPRQKKA